MQSRKPLKSNNSLKAKTPLKAAKKPKKTKPPTITKLRREADKYFSQYIRLRDNNICITCGGVGNQAGHFMSRRYNATRYDEENVNAQCYRCNVLFYGEQYKYAQELELKYGRGTANKLSKLAKQSHPFKTEELQEIINYSLENIAIFEKLRITN